jgi:ATP-binding cassette, subfamily C, bacterial LapB
MSTPETSPSASIDVEAWTHALLAVARDYSLSPSPEETRLFMLSAKHLPIREATCAAARELGLYAQAIGLKRAKGLSSFTPCLAAIDDGSVILIKRVEKKTAVIAVVSRTGAVERIVELKWLAAAIDGPVVAIASTAKARDSRIDSYLAPYQRSWFRALLVRHLMRFTELAGGAFFANVLALATAIFAMQIWDRVIPAQSLPTLWVLTLGVAVALFFELVLKMMKVVIADNFGKALDLQISSLFFARALYIRNDKRPKSSGTLIAQLRELDQIREMLTSTTLSVFFEIPFIFIFMTVIAVIGGPLVFVVAAVVPVVLVMGIIIQWPLARLSREGMRESALRNAMLVETIDRIEDVKALQVEHRFVEQWRQVVATAGVVGLRQRFLTALLLNATQTMQQVAYVAVLVVGAHIVLSNGMSTGALLACSILTSRTIAPLAQIASVFARLQGAKVARQGLDQLLKLPTDHGGSGERFHRPVIRGTFQFDSVRHVYDDGKRPSLVLPQLEIKPGERIAVLGRIGSGKSTLLKLMGGLMPPSEGRIVLDGTDMASIENADIRRDIGTLFQDSGLFFGTIRSNLQMAAPGATDEAFIAALDLACAGTALFNQSQGLDHVIHEGGRGLSNGQRQSLLLARTLVRAPRVLLLDEPTASLDEATERQFIGNLGRWLERRTLIVATHRFALLDLVQRVIVLDGGRIVMDGDKDNVLRALSGKPGARAAVHPGVAREPLVSVEAVAGPVRRGASNAV